MNRIISTKVNYRNILRQFQRTYRTDKEDNKRTFKTVVVASSLAIGAIGLNYYISQNEFEEKPNFFGKKEEKKNENISSSDDKIIQESVPKPKKNIPKHVSYVIVGTGSAGLSAAKAIRATDSCSKVLMIGSSPRVEGGENSLVKTINGESSQFYPPPYLRPPLSKQLWKRNREKMNKLLESEGDMRKHSWIFYEPESYYLDVDLFETAENGGVFLLNGDPVVELNTDDRFIVLASGQKVAFDFCLLATGARPRHLKAIEKCSETNCDLVNIGKVSYFRNLADFQWLRDTAENLISTQGRIAVIGGGFLGCELACCLSSLQEGMKLKDSEIKDNLKVVHLFRETAPMGQVLPPVLSKTVSEFEVKKNNIEVIPSCDIVSARLVDNDQVRLRYRQRNIFDGSAEVKEIDVDQIVCAVGVEPNVDLSRTGSLEVDDNNGGYLVNSEMESRAGIYVAGDVASYYDPVLGFRRRVEHLNFAEETGSIAGKNMAISSLKLNKKSLDSSYTTIDPFLTNKYKHQSSVWSALGQGVTWDGVGMCDAKNLITKSFFLKTSKAIPDKSTQGPDETTDEKVPSISSEAEKISSLNVLENEFNSDKQGIVYYLTPKDRRIVGILLWNIEDDYLNDDELSPPSRLNMARKVLSEKIKIPQDLEGEQRLLEITKRFDLGMKISEDYDELLRISAEVEKKLASENNKKKDNPQ